MVSVSQLLKSKGSDIWSVAPEDTVYEALKVMADKGIGALLVLEDDKLVGVFSERDYARKIVLRGKSSIDTPIREVMTAEVFHVEDTQSIEECMALMTEKRVRHLPVFAGGELVGVISIGDVVKAVISHQDFVIEQLENYISGR